MALPARDVVAEIAALSIKEREDLAADLTETQGRDASRQMKGMIFHHFAAHTFEAFGTTATQLAAKRPIFACGGRASIPRDAFALAEADSGVARLKLYSNNETAIDGDLQSNPILSWNIAETAVLDDVRSTLAPGCSAVAAHPLRLVRNVTNLAVKDILSSATHEQSMDAPALSLGMLVVGFGHDVKVMVRDTSGEPSRVSDLRWGADAAVDAETASRDDNESYTATWAACYNDANLVTTVGASPDTWFALYHLTAVPAAHPASLAPLVALDEPLLVQHLRALFESDDKRPVAYFTQFAYAHTELDAVGSGDIRGLLRGLDLTVALAAQQQGYAVKAVPVWFRDRPTTRPPFTSVAVPPAPEGDDEDDGEPRPMDYRPLVGAAFRAPDGHFINNIREVIGAGGESMHTPDTFRWVNFPQHYAAGAIFDAEQMSCDEEDRLCAWCTLALLMGPPSKSESDSHGEGEGTDVEDDENVGADSDGDDSDEKKVPTEVDPAIQSFQTALEAACTSVPWMCQGSQPLADQVVRVGVASEPPFVQHFPQRGSSDLSAFLAACLPASFGRGKEAVTDESYRKALALEVNRVAVDWHPAGDILQIIERLLTPTMPPLRAVLGKVNVYGPGNFFKSHVDTPRDVHMVGTLVVCLPSTHTGGELRLKHEEKEVLVNLSDASDTAAVLRWCAFFSDVEHEVLPVYSGFRVTLTYDLVADLIPPTISDGTVDHTVNFGPEGQLTVLPRALPTTRPASAAVILDVLSQLTSVFGITRTQWVAIFCSHAYPLTPRGLVDQKLLKGVDALLWRALTDEGFKVRLKQVFRFDPEETVEDETDPNQPPDLSEDWEGRTFERYAVCNEYTHFYTGGGGDGNEPPWDASAYGTGPASLYTPAFASRITFLNKPKHMLACGAWDHIMGNWPQESEVFYGTMAILVYVPTHTDRAWDRRKHAVAGFGKR
jgi:hypothetical protein